MRDFTFTAYEFLITALEEKGYTFVTFEEFVQGYPAKAVILRHDVDKRPEMAVRMAEYESQRSIRGSYQIRVPKIITSDYEAFIIKIAGLGHEIGYHYEDFSRAMLNEKYFKKLGFRPMNFNRALEEATTKFQYNLNYLRQFYPVRVISMHGNPWSEFDNRELWKYQDYRKFGVLCEPYFDIDYSRVDYYTDTGRSWDAGSSNRRDRVSDISGKNSNKRKDKLPHSTFQLIRKIEEVTEPHSLVINTHPQRWINDLVPWISELLGQNIRNFAKTFFR